MFFSELKRPVCFRFQMVIAIYQLKTDETVLAISRKGTSIEDLNCTVNNNVLICLYHDYNI